MTLSSHYKNIIVFLMGFAGTGKLTIAKELVKHPDFILADADTLHGDILRLANVNNFVPEEVWQRVAPVRDAVLDTIAHLAPREFSYVFTYEMFENNDYSNVLFQKIKQVAEIRKALFIPVRLICNEEELVKRVQQPDRKQLFKTTDADRSRMQMKNQQVFFSREPYEITINNTLLSPQQVVDEILSKIHQIIY